MDALIRDFRFAARGLVRTPVFTSVAIASLAIGLALATSTVSVVNAYLIRSLPYPAADRLYHVRYAPPGPWEPAGMSGLDWKSVGDVVEFPIAAAGDTFYFNEGGSTLALRGLRALPGFVEGLGVRVSAGRNLMPQDFGIGAEPVALIGHSLWRDRFGSDPSVVGRLIRTEPEQRPGTTETHRIVGVIASGFYYGNDRTVGVDLMMPNPTPTRVYMLRLRDGIPPQVAERRLTEAARKAATAPIPDNWTGVQLDSARDRRLGDARPVLYGITAAVSLVMLIVCANVAVLMLLRAIRRQKEVAVRLALGSGWVHIARMLLAETSLICAAALALGLAATALTLDTLAPLIERQLGRQSLSASGIALDTNVLVIVGGLSVFIAVALSLLPMTSWGRSLTNALRQDGRTSSDGRSMRRVRSGLIALEVAGSVMLLIGCGLMIRSVATMMSTDLGFQAEGLQRSRVMLRARNYADAPAYRAFYERFAGSVSTAMGSPLVYSSWVSYVPPPVHVIRTEVGDTSAGAIAVSAGYFSTLGIPMRQGREFTPEEVSGDAPIAVISETLASRLWPADNALGRRVREVVPTSRGPQEGPWRTVVGVSANVRQSYDDADQSDFYTPRLPDNRFGSFYVRAPWPTPQLSDQLQRAAAEIDRDAIVSLTRSAGEDDLTMAGSRFITGLLSAFAVIAAFLAMLGLYGVTAYAVQQRRKEMAIRAALGASGRTIFGIFLRDGAWLLGMGTIVGVIGGILSARVLRSQLIGVETFDVATLAIACGLLLAAGFSAIAWAARGAARTNPAGALNAN